MFIVLIGILLVLLHIWSQRKYYYLYYQAGGPFGLPILGVALKFRNATEILHNLQYMNQKYGPVCCSWLGTKFILYIADPNTIKLVLNSAECLNKSQLYDAMEPLIKTGILIAKGAKWQRRRKMLSDVFSHSNLIEFTSIFNTVTNEFITKLKSDHKVNLNKLIQRLAFEAACYTTMGQRLNVVKEPSSEIFDSFNKIIVILVQKLAKPWLNNATLFKATSKLYNLEVECLRIFKSFIRTIIDDKFHGNKGIIKNKLEPNCESENDQNDLHDERPKFNFIDKVNYLFENRELTLNEVEDEANTIIITAFETVTSFIYSTIILLAMHSDYQEKLRQEICGLGKKSTDEITYDDLKKLKYLEMILNESMRVLPPVPITIRLCEKDFKLNDKMTVPEGTQILIDIFNLHRSERYYGMNAKKFNPDNFLPEAVSDRHPYAFIPFAKGLRTCIGTRYAYVLAKVFFTKLLQQYRIATTTKLEELRFIEGVSLKIQNEIKVDFEIINDPPN